MNQKGRRRWPSFYESLGLRQWDRNERRQHYPKLYETRNQNEQ